MLNQNPEDLFVPEKLITYAKRIEKVMKKVIEVDKNYWEPYRMLAKLCIDRSGSKNYYILIFLIMRTSDLGRILMLRWSI